MAQHWRPGAENFFDRIKKAQILSILGGFDPEIALRYAAAKKTELATAAARLCSGDTIIEPEIKAKALAWVPDVMRFDGVATIPVGDGIAVDDGHEVAEDLPLDAANQNDADGPLSQAA
jgi:ParB family chromosome partitioning protein